MLFDWSAFVWTSLAPTWQIVMRIISQVHGITCRFQETKYSVYKPMFPVWAVFKSLYLLVLRDHYPPAIINQQGSQEHCKKQYVSWVYTVYTHFLSRWITIRCSWKLPYDSDKSHEIPLKSELNPIVSPLDLGPGSKLRHVTRLSSWSSVDTSAPMMTAWPWLMRPFLRSSATRVGPMQLV